MKTEKVARDNVLFFFTVVGPCLLMKEFVRAVLWSSVDGVSQFPTENVDTGKPGYIRVDTFSLRKEEKSWDAFVREAVERNLFEKVSFGFSSRTEFGGDFSEIVTIKRCGYEFLFKITGYERNSLHSFKIIEPDALPHIPDGEVLGRVVCLTVQLDDPA